MGGKRKKKSASEASRELVWGEERVAEPEEMPLMPPFHDTRIWYHALIGHVFISTDSRCC